VAGVVGGVPWWRAELAEFGVGVTDEQDASGTRQVVGVAQAGEGRATLEGALRAKLRGEGGGGGDATGERSGGIAGRNQSCNGRVGGWVQRASLST
jgi:hypothetical protein